MSSSNSLKAIIGVVGAAAVGAAIYFLIRESSSDEKNVEVAVSPATMDVESFAKILDDIIESQRNCTDLVNQISKELCATHQSFDTSFEKLYHDVKARIPEDPMERYGISPEDFEALMSKFSSNPSIEERISTIFTPNQPSNSAVDMVKVESIKKKDIVEVYGFMLQCIEAISKEFSEIPDHHTLDMKVVTFALQALVSARTEHKFNLTASEVEGAIALNTCTLTMDPEFTSISIKLQQALNDLISTSSM